MDFYFAFSDKLSYDRYSFDVNYEKEYNMMDYLWEHCEEGENVNLTILFLYVAKKFFIVTVRKMNREGVLIHYRLFLFLLF